MLYGCAYKSDVRRNNVKYLRLFILYGQSIRMGVAKCNLNSQYDKVWNLHLETKMIVSRNSVETQSCYVLFI